MSHTILIVDDEETIRESLRGILEDEGYLVEEAPSGEACLQHLRDNMVSAILLDIWMTGIDGLETLRRLKKAHEEIPVIMMSGHGTIETAVSATKMGAYDFLEKPLSLDRVLLLLERAIRQLSLLRENRALKAQVEVGDRLVGESPPMKAIRDQIERLAPTEGWVLITGENGTGKEVAARHIHALSLRREGPFVAVNSAAIPEEMIESELFGHEKGSLPGATSARSGRFEQASGGTLFLDEIGDMSVKTQSKIMRLLQEQHFERVGGNRRIEVDVRVIAASNKDLPKEIVEGRFREDLYYRLNVIPLRIPPLRERLEDVDALVGHFVRTARGRLPERTFSAAALAGLRKYHWPGNVRELKNLVERLLIMAAGLVIEPSDLPEFLLSPRGAGGRGLGEDFLGAGTLREARENFERAYLRAHLENNGGNVTRTADAVGVERSALHRKLKSLGLIG